MRKKVARRRQMHRWIYRCDGGLGGLGGWTGRAKMLKSYARALDRSRKLASWPARPQLAQCTGLRGVVRTGFNEIGLAHRKALPRQQQRSKALAQECQPAPEGGSMPKPKRHGTTAGRRKRHYIVAPGVRLRLDPHCTAQAHEADTPCTAACTTRPQAKPQGHKQSQATHTQFGQAEVLARVLDDAVAAVSNVWPVLDIAVQPNPIIRVC